MDIVEKLKRMSQWMWATDQDLERNKVAREAYQEIQKLRKQLAAQQNIKEIDASVLAPPSKREVHNG